MLRNTRLEAAHREKQGQVSEEDALPVLTNVDHLFR